MKKKFFITLFTSFLLSNGSVFAITYDSSSLTNKISQNKSLSEMFFKSFSDFVNDICFDFKNEDEDEEDYDDDSKDITFKFKTSLDAVYYAGFNINTDYGTQEGSLVRGYSDLLIGAKIRDIVLAFGTAGSRYGVFLTDIDFNIPSGDPVHSIKVNDFMGTQIMTDIYSGVLGIKDYIWIGGYFLSTSNYKPEESGMLSSSKDSAVDFWGLKGQFSNIVAVDLLFNREFELQSFDWSFNPVPAAMFLLSKPLHYDFEFTTGMAWYTKEENSSAISSKTISSINWGRFDIPLNFHYDLGNKKSSLNFDGNITFSHSDTFKTFYLGKAGLGITAESLAILRNYHYWFGFMLKSSFYQDEKLVFHGKTDNEYAVGFLAGFSLRMGKNKNLLLNFAWRYNYIDDLISLVEAKDKHVFAGYISLKN